MCTEFVMSHKTSEENTLLTSKPAMFEWEKMTSTITINISLSIAHENLINKQ